ncbi:MULTISPECIES: hypothetical protein [Photorhabdus]|uniref:Uncharacterized protein n=2 Tax=Photorhabdus asymbiotica TaxID=291112 RepID=C7BL26_PHOAA|nr:hypothetical protein [Photorhabdus asymbiotica]RKS59571.1 hypothetical protein BDD30_1648 [Photorhabdus asymbiotica]CAQ85701.1 Hypothetical protein PAU_03613 [Photorhabdus asymbiotica]
MSQQSKFNIKEYLEEKLSSKSEYFTVECDSIDELMQVSQFLSERHIMFEVHFERSRWYVKANNKPRNAKTRSHIKFAEENSKRTYYVSCDFISPFYGSVRAIANYEINEEYRDCNGGASVCTFDYCGEVEEHLGDMLLPRREDSRNDREYEKAVEEKLVDFIMNCIEPKQQKEKENRDKKEKIDKERELRGERKQRIID